MLFGVNIFSGGFVFNDGGLIFGNVSVFGIGVLGIGGMIMLDSIVVLNLVNVVNFGVVM